MRLERVRADGRRDCWEAALDGRRLTITAGIVGGPVKTTSERFLTARRAQAALEKQAAAIRASGFVEPTALDASGDLFVGPRNPVLEAAMREDRESPGAASVYADWLQAEGSELGELMVLQLARAAGADAAHAQRIHELAQRLRLPDEELATWGWKHGRWEWLRLENNADLMDASFDAVALARRLFELPLCAALDELRIGVLRWEHNHADVPAVLAAAEQHAWAASLSRLHLGDVDADIDMDHHVIGDVGVAISRVFPALESLKLHSGAQDWRGGETFGVAGLALPKLTSLVVETCAMTRERLSALLAAQLPALERVELWFGAVDRGATAGASELEPVLDGTVFPKVERLALKNHELSGALIERLAASRIAPRLVELDLSMSTLDDDEVRALAATAGRYPALRTLNVDDCFLTNDGLADLRAAFSSAEVVSREQAKLEEGADERFVSVWE